MKTLRVVQISREYSPNGGVGSYLLRLVPALEDSGHEVTVIHSDPNATRSRGAFASEYFEKDFYLWDSDAVCRNAADKVLEILEAVNPDIVHIQSNNNFLLEAEIRQRFAAVKSLHVYDFCPSGNKFHYATQTTCTHPTGALCVPRMGYKRCLLSKRPSVIWWHQKRAVAANVNNSHYSKLIVGSEYVRQQSIATGYPESQVHALHYFTELPEIADAPVAAEPTILFVGRVVREKGLDRLLRTLAMVRGEWRLVVDGDGPDLDRIKSLAAQQGLANRVEFAGWTASDRHAQLYQMASVVVVPSIWPEPFGIVGIEAMSYGKPVVAFSVGGIPEWLDHGVTGFLVNELDEREMAARITYLLENPSQAAALGARGRERVKERFSKQQHVRCLLGIYEQAIRHSGQSKLEAKTGFEAAGV